MATVRIGSARIDERGRASGGRAGDQTGGEVATQSWYKHSKGWVVLRARNPVLRGYIADAMRAACDNNKIGYDQYQRLTLYEQVKDKGFDPAKATTACETDCSALVRVCVLYGFTKCGIKESVRNFTTGNQAAALLETGWFEKLTESKYTARSDYLKKGDVLVTRSKGHTVVVLSDGSGVSRRYELGDRVLSVGCEGTDVKAMQEALLSLGYDLGRWGADGRYGAATERAVRAFQRDNRLEADGVAGPLTIGALLDVFDHPEQEEQEDQEEPEKPETARDYPVHALDLSEYNSARFSKIDWEGIRDNVGFLILRASILRKTTNPRGFGMDLYFKRFAAKSKEYGIPIWVYHYSRGTTVEEARAEADYLYKTASPYGPVGYALDCEERGIKVSAFFARLYELGAQKTMLYIGHNWYPIYNLPVGEDGHIQCCDADWIPRYGKNDGTAKDRYRPKYPCDLWQYTSKFACDWIPDKTLDCNKLNGRRSMAWFRGEE